MSRFQIMIVGIALVVMQCFVTPVHADEYEPECFEDIHIYTPNGSRISADHHMHHYDDAYWEAVTYRWDIEFEGLYLYRVEPASYEYNCHAYTWAGRRQDTPLDSLYWVNSCQKYWDDFSYQQVSFEEATIAVYNTKRYPQYHSVCMYDSLTGDGQRIVTSKWGELPTYRHVLFNDIYATAQEGADSSLTTYYRPWPDPWVIEENTTLEMMKDMNFRRSLGSITIKSGITVTLADNDTLMMHAGKNIDVEGTLILQRGARITKCIGSRYWLVDGEWGTLNVKPGGTVIIHKDSSIDSLTAINIDDGGAVIYDDDIVSAVDETAPGTFDLLPAYPNPFNSSTTISFVLPKTDRLLLTVYSVTGQKVETLADGIAEAGTHRVMFDGTGLSSGIYLVRLETVGLAETRKLLLYK